MAPLDKISGGGNNSTPAWLRTFIQLMGRSPVGEGELSPFDVILGTRDTEIAPPSLADSWAAYSATAHQAMGEGPGSFDLEEFEAKDIIDAINELSNLISSTSGLEARRLDLMAESQNQQYLMHQERLALDRQAQAFYEDKSLAELAAGPAGVFQLLAMGKEAGGDVGALTDFLRNIPALQVGLPAGMERQLGNPDLGNIRAVGDAAVHTGGEDSVIPGLDIAINLNQQQFDALDPLDQSLYLNAVQAQTGEAAADFEKGMRKSWIKGTPQVAPIGI